MPEAVRKTLMTAGIAIAVYLGMKYLLALAAPFFAAWILVRLLYPLAGRLKKYLPFRQGTLTIVLMVFFLALTGVGFWYLAANLCSQIRSVIANLDLYEQKLQDMLGGCCSMVERTFGIQREDTLRFVNNNLNYLEERIEAHVVPNLFQNSIRYLKTAFRWAGILFIIFIAVTLIVRDYKEIKGRLKGYPLYHHAMNVVGRLWTLGGAWLKAQALLMLIVIIICVIGLTLTGNPYALLLGILIGILDVLPFLGTGTVLLPWAALCLLQRDFFHGIAYAALFLVANTTREYLEPRLIGEKMGVYPIVIALVVYLGMCIYGPTGVLLGPLSLLVILEILKEAGILGEGRKEEK
ncbi:MAG: AI-2E family transporter [Candidatus Limivivens sp.]|nr:AI-2E family transporter [Candidatus Limivivens sp.]